MNHPYGILYDVTFISNGLKSVATIYTEPTALNYN